MGGDRCRDQVTTTSTNHTRLLPVLLPPAGVASAGCFCGLLLRVATAGCYSGLLLEVASARPASTHLSAGQRHIVQGRQNADYFSLGPCRATEEYLAGAGNSGAFDGGIGEEEKERRSAGEAAMRWRTAETGRGGDHRGEGSGAQNREDQMVIGPWCCAPASCAGCPRPWRPGRCRGPSATAGAGGQIRQEPGVNVSGQSLRPRALGGRSRAVGVPGEVGAGNQQGAAGRCRQHARLLGGVLAPWQ